MRDKHNKFHGNKIRIFFVLHINPQARACIIASTGYKYNPAYRVATPAAESGFLSINHGLIVSKEITPNT